MVILTEYLRRRCLALQAEDRADLAGMLLQSLEGEPRTDKAGTLAAIRRAVLDAYGVDILRRGRSQPGADCKMIAASLALDLLPITQSEVARWMGVKPCTANYYERRVREALGTPARNPRLLAEYKTIFEQYGKNNS
jgi:hypothetical protein